MKSLLHLLAVAIGGYAVFAALIYVFQSRMIFQPNLFGVIAGGDPSDIDLDFEDVFVDAEDGVRVHGWFVPANPVRGVLLFFHGNAGNITHRLDSIALFHGLGLSVFIVDYRGYGRSEGRPTEQGTYRDARAAWRYLTQARGIDPGKIVVFGRSLGAAMASRLGMETSAAGLIVESAFTSVPDMAARHYPYLPVRRLTRFRYDTLEHVQNSSVPVLVVHSENDEIAPFEMGRAIFENAPEPKSFVTLNGGHNEAVFTSTSAYLSGLREFLDRVVPVDSGPGEAGGDGDPPID
jgi:fermentation-respiration switch protein FrsA (DUF1100 family)